MAEGGPTPTLRATSTKSKRGATSKPTGDTSVLPEPGDHLGDGASIASNCHSNLEIEYLESEAESETHWKRCQKNPGHTAFIPASEFSLHRLPEPYRNNLYFKGIRALSRLTVRIRVKYTSKNRPDDDPSARYRGRKVPRVGSGFLDEFMFYERFFDLEHPDYNYAADAVLDAGRYVSKGDPDDVDRSKKVPCELSPEECLSMIKTLREKFGLSDVDEEDFYARNEDELDDEEEEKAVLAGFNNIGKKIASCSIADTGRHLGAVVIPNDDYCDEDDDDDDDDYDGSYDYDAALGLGNDSDDDEDDEWSGSKKYRLIKIDSRNMPTSHKSSIPPNLDVKFRYDPDEDILNQTFRPVNPCPCRKCIESDKPEPHGYYVNVWTARHVVFDSEEAKQTEVDLFYDKEGDDDNIKHMDVIQVHSHSHKGDWAVLMCATHDQALVSRLRIIMTQMLKRIDRMRKKSTIPLAVICSHPHGYAKQISIGDWTHRMLYPTRREGIGPPAVAQSIPRSVGSSYLYDTPTCPGSSGAAVLILGHRQETQLLESPFHPHHGSHNSTLNKSGISHSTHRKLEELPASLLCKILHKYEEMGKEEFQQESLNEEVKTDRAIRAEKLQKYLAILKQRDADSKEREEILKNAVQRKKEIEEEKQRMRKWLGGGFESIEDFLNSD